MTRSLLIAALVCSFSIAASTPAYAEETTPTVAAAPTVSVVRSQFAEKIENRLPVGGSSFESGKLATYWVEVSNAGEPTDVTLVWKLDGKEVARQSLEVGRAPHWRTWGMCGTQKAHTIDVELLDKEGHSLKTDTTTAS